MSERVLIEVVPGFTGWIVTVDGEEVFRAATQKAAIAEGRLRGRASWEGGQAAELKVHGRDGRYLKSGSSYGRDPERSPG